MISSLDIRSLGVIDSAHLDIGPGLTVLTGETGAGKTMVLTSLRLLLGGRADAALVRSGAEQALVDAVLAVPDDLVDAARRAGGIVDEDELIVSRTVAARGRSRAHLGSRPVPASVLADLVGSVVTIHGQSDQIRLTAPAAQRRALDDFGGPSHAELLTAYREAWGRAVEIKRALDEAVSASATRSDEIARLRAAVDAIDALDLRPGEDDELRAESRRLTNVQDLRLHLGRVDGLLRGQGEAPGALDAVRMSLDELRHAERFDAGLAPLSARLVPLALELDALADDAADYCAGLDADPQRLSAVHERRAAIRHLLEGRAADVDGLLRWRADAGDRLSDLTRPGSDPDALRERLAQAQDEVLRIGADVTAARRKLASDLSARVDAELNELSMPGAHLEIALTATKPTPHGCEDIALCLQPHPSAPARPLGQGASGGELSRVMLALEVVLGAGSDARTFIFDEVDAGIGGATATAVGSRLARLAAHRQVIVVTHLAQVAAFADHHLVVEKAEGRTSVRAVDGVERQAELTRMMGGDPHSEAARRNALEVLGSAMPQSRG
ncbi:DNA repair protein RecN [Actinomyces sp. B33]|uniref:DNA repair protein RecN n=1 Tax=Actinomyces sp. B33 TaxID=2942131 RepID=UPI002341530F|nr:DNA repair protein RecN [Actinomyces sp. B33]MDC4233394.1 DNA repair protein RecN [Actinomyces sp. B33]